MHIVPNTDTVPAAVNKYLLPWERQVITVHRHPAALLAPVGVVVAGLVAALVLSALSVFTGDTLLLIWLIWFLFLLYTLWKVANWSVSYYCITAYRIVAIKGFMARDVAMIPLALTSDLILRRSTMGRVFGYGQFILSSKGQDQGLRNVKFVPYPEQLYLEVCGLIYPDRDVQKEN